MLSSSVPTGRRRRIVEAVMQTLHRAHEYRAALFRVGADGDDVIEALAVELIHMFRAMAANVYANLAHGCDRFRAHRAGFGPGAFDLERIPGIVAQQPFGHLATGGIASTENQNTFLIHKNFVGIYTAGRRPQACVAICTASQGLPSGGV